mgnify:CR=1 FL=1
MTDLDDFKKTDLVDDVLAAHVNKLQAASMQSGFGNFETLTATRELVDNDTAYQVFTLAAAAQDVELPALNTAANHIFLIMNDASSSYAATVKTFSGAATVATLAAGEASLFVADDGTWAQIGGGGNDDGWISVLDTWTYASATTITVPSGAASIYSVGDPFKLTANSVVLQGYIVGVANTLLTVLGDTLTNHAFSNIAYSKSTKPAGFSVIFSYTPTYTNFSLVNGTVSAEYKVSESSVEGLIEIVMGSESSVTGNMYISLPITPSNSIRFPIATITFLDSGAAQYTGLGVVQSSSVRLKAFGAGGTYATQVDVNATVPFTWAASDQILLNFRYEF